MDKEQFLNQFTIMIDDISKIENQMMRLKEHKNLEKKYNIKLYSAFGTMIVKTDTGYWANGFI